MSLSKPVLVLTMGLPRSGKSTWARQQGVPIVNADAIRLALHGQAFIGLAEPFVWAIAKVMVRALFIAGHDRIILDATNVTKSRRNEWKSSSWTREYQVFNTSKEECLQRALDTDQDYLVPIIEKMATDWEPLDDEDKDDG